MRSRVSSALALALAATALTGCVAAVIPVLAGGAIASRGDGNKAVPTEASVSAPAASNLNETFDSVFPDPVPAPEPAPASEPAPAAQPAPAQAPLPTDAPAPAPDNAAPVPPVDPALRLDTGSDPAFRALVGYARRLALGADAETPLLSAMLADPVETDGRRKLCTAGERLLVLIDLDPADGTFAPPARPATDAGRALGLSLLRDAGVLIAWISDNPPLAAIEIRSALEAAGLDPRGEDIIALRNDPAERKQTRRESLAQTACVIAIAGDERADFDERFRYLKDPSVGVGLEAVIGDGWFLIQPLLAPTAQ